MASLAKRAVGLTFSVERIALSVSKYGRASSTVSAAVKPLLITATRAAYPSFRHISTSYCRFAEEAKATQTNTVAPATAAPAAEVPVTPVISHDDVVHGISYKRATILDVRTQFEVNEFGKIPGSVLLPHDRVDSAMKLPGGEFKATYGFYKPDPAGESIIVYCRSGKRAEFAGKILLKQFGFRNVFNYLGGWLEWEQKHPEHVNKLMPSAEELQKLMAAAAGKK